MDKLSSLATGTYKMFVNVGTTSLANYKSFDLVVGITTNARTYTLTDDSSGSIASAQATGGALDAITGSGATDSLAAASGTSVTITLGTARPLTGLSFGTATGKASSLSVAIDAASTTDANTFRLVQTEAQSYVDSLISQRSLLGAYQNQMEYTVSNVTELSGNLAAAKSRVIDTDYAAETASLTKGQILQQAATAMLAQANQMPNVILTLLK
jgi:flagellin